MGHRSEADHLDLNRADAYGRSFADVYDLWYESVSDAVATAAFVAARSTGPVLELGVGSGRLARPLTKLGLRVVGLDGSAEMLERCTAEGDAGISLVRADMRALPFNGNIGAALIAFNTVFNLATEQDQRALFVELRRLIGTTGVVIVEALDVSPLLNGPARSIGLREIDGQRAVVTATDLSKLDQVVNGQHLEISDGGISVRPWRLRWMTPDQMDEMAAAAGLIRTERYRSWDKQPFTKGSETHISVYAAAKPDPSSA